MASGNDGRVNADYLTGHIHQRHAGISRIDGGVGLQESLELLAHIATILGADNSGRNAALQESKRIANRQGPISNLNSVGVAEFSGRQIMSDINLYDGKVGLFIRADDLRRVRSLVAIQSDLDLGSLVHDVIVGEDVSLSVDDHTRTQTAF